MMENLLEMRKARKVLVVGLLLILIGLITTSVAYVSRLKRILNEEANRYLAENSQLLSSSIRHHVQTDIKYLQNMVRTMPDKNDLWSDANFKHILQMWEEDFFIHVGIADKNGIVLLEDGRKINIDYWTDFKPVYMGQNMIQIAWKYEDGSAAIAYFSPIMENNQCVGTTVAFASVNHLRAAINTKNFGGEGYSFIINRAGRVIVNSNNANTPVEIHSLFDKNMYFENNDARIMLQNMQNGLEGRVNFSISNADRKIANYVPIGVNDWFLVSVVPENSVTEQTDSLIQFSSNANAMTTLVFIMLCGLVFYMLHGLEKQIFTDPITEGPNGTWFGNEVRNIMKTAQPNQYAMVSLDVERFKLLNDSFGVQEGNLTLRYILERIRVNIHAGELCVRATEDNFYILMEENEPQVIIARLERIITDINSFNDSMEQTYYLNLAIGIYHVSDTGLEVIAMQDRADVARKNKDKIMLSYGGSCVFYTEKERQKMMEEKDITNSMEKALQQKEFVVYLQPKYEVDGNTIAGAEALVRWMHPRFGMIAPDLFIPVFEKYGFIMKLDMYVFEEVCKKLRQWKNKGINPVPISVNLSRMHLYNPKFMENYMEIFNKYDLSPKLIEFELTETMVFENMKQLLAVIDEIHKMGFSCALDDFGSGYSSLNMLREVPVDVLKLDKAFFDEGGELRDEARGIYVVEAVVGLAKKLKMKTVSEGVETWLQVETLRNLECDMIQGYVFSKPIPMDDFEKLAFSDDL